MNTKMNHYKAQSIKYQILCWIEAIAMVVIGFCRPLHLMFTHEMYSREDNIGLFLCITFVVLLGFFLNNHKSYSVYDYKYRVYLHRIKMSRKQTELENKRG